MTEVDTVLCFDRDLTVNVNFDSHEVYMRHGVKDARGVPLRYVKAYAHECENVATWSTGNQHLRREAGICGIKEARSIWEDQRGEDVRETYPSEGYYSYKPSRRNGLRLIKDVYEHEYEREDLPTFIVVDDADLGDMVMEGIDHWYPWVFVKTLDSLSLPDVSDTELTDTSVEAKECHEDLIRSADGLPYEGEVMNEEDNDE